MRHPFFTLTCALLFLISLNACKKAEQSTPAEPGAPIQAPSVSQESSAPAEAAGAQGSVRLQVKWPVGNRYVYRMDLDSQTTNRIPGMPSPMQQTVTMAMTYGLTVLRETENNGRELQMEFLANEMDIKMANQLIMSFDSKEEAGQNEGQNPFAAPFRKMIGSKVNLQLDADGRVEKVIGFDEWLDSLAGEEGGPGRTLVAQQFSEDYFRQIADLGRSLPTKPAEVGDTWPLSMDIPAGPMGKLDMNATILFKDWEQREGRNCAVLEAVGTFQGVRAQATGGPLGNMSIDQGKVTGTTWFAADLGAVVESDSKQTMRLKGNMPSPPGAKTPAPEINVELGQNVRVKLVELTQGATAAAQ